jgi:hypothetical protein
MNDFQNAHETGKMIRMQQDSERLQSIYSLTSAGKFCLVAQTVSYCPFTDATAGCANHLLEAFDTREEAEAAASYHYEAFPAEVDYVVFPLLPRPQAARIDRSEAPF